MKGGRIRATTFSLMAGGLLLALFLVSLHAAHSLNASRRSLTNSTLGRGEDPVIVTGAQLPVIGGAPIDQLMLYAYSAGDWNPVPYQIDERMNDITGTFVVFEDGLLDDNDELVFMAKDSGQQAGSSWPDDQGARDNARYEIQASDPLTVGHQGWAYLFRSTTLLTSSTSYVDWNQSLQQISTISYTAAFSPSSFLGLADLTINNNDVDILDRQKIRVETFIIDLTEEGLIAYVDPTISIPVVGAVRGVAGAGQLGISIYGARLDLDVEFDTSIVPFNIDEIRTSFDLNDPAQTGVTYFFDSNGSAYTIDGNPDAVDSTPRFDWFQASGAAGGLVVVVPEADAGPGQISNYYKDDDIFDAGDTGDGLSFADTGLRITDPGSEVLLELAMYVLPPGSTANVGPIYFDRTNAPVEVIATAQRFGEIYLPFMIKPS